MAFKPSPGMRVISSRLGPGMVVKISNSSAVVALDKMPGLPVSLAFSALRPESPVVVDEPPAQESSEPTRIQKRRPMAEDQVRARRSIEALRFGIVPFGSIRDLTVDFDELQGWVVEHLPHERDGFSHVSAVCGPFGSGKSHTMAAIRVIAAECGYVTAHVEVSGSDVSLSDPEGVLRQLWPTCSVAERESATPLLDLNLAAIANGKAQTSTALAEYERVLANLDAIGTLKRLDCLDPHVDDIEGFVGCSDALTANELQRRVYEDVQRHGGNWRSDPFTFKRLIGSSLSERPRDFVKCLLGYASLARRAGHKGLVVTIDEFEVEHNLSDTKWVRLTSLLETMEDQLGGEAAPLSIFIATVGQEGERGDPVVDNLVRVTGGDCYYLKGWSRDSMLELAKGIHRLYRQAYETETSFDRRLVDRTYEALDPDDLDGSGVVRAFIKHYVAVVDSIDGPGAK